MTQLSVNINKFALLRNSRGQNTPDLMKIAKQCIAAGVVGITVHPRPDGRHIRMNDLPTLSGYLKSVQKEFNIEGYPSPDFIELVCQIAPTQVTLVPDPPEALTSSFGWDLAAHAATLRPIVQRCKDAGIRVALFADPEYEQWDALSEIQPDRIELFTYAYAARFSNNPQRAIAPYQSAAKAIQAHHISLNAGHDLSLDNLEFFIQNIPTTLEVSIGHALVCESLQLGLDETLRRYQEILNSV